jgi:hypothetical protein
MYKLGNDFALNGGIRQESLCLKKSIKDGSQSKGKNNALIFSYMFLGNVLQYSKFDLGTYKLKTISVFVKAFMCSKKQKRLQSGDKCGNGR